MKHGHSFAVGMLAMLLVACGGGGSDHSSSTATTTPRVEAIVTGAAVDPLYRYQDPLSIQAGDTLQFQLVSYDSSGSRKVLSVDSWRSSDTLNTYGVIAPSSGDFTASSRDSGDLTFIATARYKGTDYSANYRVNPRQVRILGRLLAQGTLSPIANATIDVYGPSNAADQTTAITRLATVQTAENGTFRVSVRATNDSVTDASAASPLYFTIRSSSIPASGYYDSFVFRGQRYDAGTTACLAPLTNADGTPFTTGDRFLADSTDDSAETNGTILLTPTSDSDFPSRPSSDGCVAN